MQCNSIEEIIEDLKQGRMVIIMDDEDRENEGDLLMAAEAVRPEDINFMARYGRGLICLTLNQQRCQQLRLPLMVRDNQEQLGTNFTVSIEAAEGVTTGISAADRAKTIQAAVKADATADDLVQPGHVFPLMARPGGVLTRAGHTEAGCDLARLAGFEPAAAIVEILNEDGTMARRPDLEVFAEEHGLKIGTIEDLIRYRIENEKTVERIVEAPFETDYGLLRMVAYEDAIGQQLHFALVKGEVQADKGCTVRVHLQNTLNDTLLGTHGRGWPLQDAIRRVAESESGVLVFLSQAENARDMIRHIEGLIHGELNTEDSPPYDQRTYGIGAQILADLGVGRMLLVSAPKRFHALAGFGLEVVGYVE